MQHILIVGRNGVGKSTLIRALLSAITAPIDGVITKKEAPGPDGFCPVYIHRYGKQRCYSPENLIGKCREGKSVAFPEAFERFAEATVFPPDSVIVLDELGFLESNSPVFTGAVLRLLDDAPFVIAAVRDKQTAFLDAVRAHPRAGCHPITEENRDALTERLLCKVKALRL